MSSPKKTKRLRIFAGPNGSGKTTLAKNLKQNPNKRIKLGIFVNADEIEKLFKENGYFSLNKYFRFKVNTKDLRSYIIEHGMSHSMLNVKNIEQNFKIIKNRIYYKESYNSYIAADIAGFVRKQLMEKGKDFSFESVFSHHSKLETMRQAIKLGYRVYFYFVTTDDVDINVNRVKIRVSKDGHPVPEKKIISRYYRSLDLLFDAVKISSRAYLFDNSGQHYELVAEISDGKKVIITDYDGNIPNWFIEYVFDKKST